MQPGTVYKCIKRATVRADFDMDSASVGHVELGERIEALECRLNEKGQLRLRFEGGWTSVAAGSGTVLFAKMETTVTAGVSGPDCGSRGPKAKPQSAMPVSAPPAPKTKTHPSAEVKTETKQMKKAGGKVGATGARRKSQMLDDYTLSDDLYSISPASTRPAAQSNDPAGEARSEENEDSEESESEDEDGAIGDDVLSKLSKDQLDGLSNADHQAITQMAALGAFDRNSFAFRAGSSHTPPVCLPAESANTSTFLPSARDYCG